MSAKDVARVINLPFFSKKDRFYIYLKKPVNNKDLSLIGYCFDLACLVMVKKEEPESIYLYEGIGAVMANIVDLDKNIKHFSKSHIDDPKVLPLEFGSAVDYVAFGKTVKIHFVRL